MAQSNKITGSSGYCSAKNSGVHFLKSGQDDAAFFRTTGCDFFRQRSA
jgi:hypothetical protein